MLRSSATGNASRRNNFCWPDEVSRPYCYLADMRSIAASGILNNRANSRLALRGLVLIRVQMESTQLRW
jgi:hypothetical protein